MTKHFSCRASKAAGAVLIFLFCLLAAPMAANGLWESAQPYSSFQTVLLPHDAYVVNTIAQDADGMVWLGTKRGLYNFNGYDAHNFNATAVQAIAQTDREHLFIGSDDGLRCFDLLSESFEKQPQDFRRLDYVRSLLFLDGTLWIGTRDKGLWALDMKSRRLTRATPSWHLGCIFAMAPADHGFFIGAKEGLSFYDLRTRQLRRCQAGQAMLRDIFSLHMDKAHGQLYAGTEKGLVRYDVRTDRAAQVAQLAGVCVNTIAQDPAGRLLLGTDRGFMCLDGTGRLQRFTHDSHNDQSLRNNLVRSVLCDRSGNVWLGTERGLSITRQPSAVSTVPLAGLVNSSSGNVFSAILRDRRGDYWLGGDNGLIHLAGNGAAHESTWFALENAAHPLRNNQIRSIYEDREGDIWIATDASIAHYNRATGQFDFINLSDTRGRNANWSYALYEDQQGRMWISTYQGGLYIVDRRALLQSGGSYTLTRDLFGQSDSLVCTAYNMTADDAGHVWLNFGGGMTRVDTRTLHAEQRKAYLDNFAFLEHGIWYSENGQLKRHDTSTAQVTVTSVANKEGIIYTLIPEHDNLWFSTASGIYCFDTRSGRLTNSLVTKEKYFTGFYDAQTDALLWGGEDCLLRISLHDLAASARPSVRLRVTGITVGGEQVNTADGTSPRFAERLSLNDRRGVVLEFSTLDYSNPDEINIYYRLDGDEWHALGKGQNKMSFLVLPSGTSTLEVCNTNPEIDPQAVVTVFTLRVPWPWFLRWWMWLVYAGLMLAVIALIARRIQRRNRRKFEQREKEKSLELSRQKMDFFVNMSHELKTPLSLVIAPLGVLASETQNARLRERLRPIQENAMRLSNLISRILDFKRMEYESEDVLVRSHVELCSLLQGCIRAFDSTRAERGISIRFASNVERLWLNADMMKLESIFMNLISNAVKYVSDETGEVRVGLNAGDGKVVVSVEDNGRGMDEEDIPMMAIRFFQGKNARRVGGTGIGFYLVRKFTELHGGTVGIRNNNGLSVSITLPVTGDNAIAADTDSAAPSEDSAEQKQATLLLIDDNREIIDFLSTALSKDYRCVKAGNGQEGLERARECQPDLIVVDQMMPVMNGLEFCRQLRRLTQFSVTPVIMLTAKDDDRTELDSLRAGVDVFMPKPFDMRRLSLQIVQLLQKRQRMETAVSIRQISNPEFTATAVPDHRSADEVLLEQVTAIIEENMEDEGFGVAALSEKTRLDQKQLYRKLTQLTGLSTIAYIRKLRMKKAAVLLSEGRFTVTETMYLVGYSNASYFTKCFQKEFGVSPKQYAAEKRS